jgi:hypothetical protein
MSTGAEAVGDRTLLTPRELKQGAFSYALIVTTIVLAAGLALYVLATITFFPVTPKMGWTLATNGSQGLLTVMSVARGSAEERSGIRVGDVIEFSRQEWRTRTWILKPYARTPVTFLVLRGGELRSMTIDFPATLQSAKISGMLGIGVLWMIGFALAVWRRRPESGEVRAICWVLLSYAVGDSLLNFTSPSPALNVLAVFGGEPGIVLSATLFSLFALNFAPQSPARRAMRWTAQLFPAISILLACGAVLGIFTGWPNPYAIAETIQRVTVTTISPWAGVFTNEFHFLVPRTFALVCALVAIATTRGELRRRISWATAAMTLLYGTTFLSQPFVLLGIITPVTGNMLVDWGVFFVPVGLTYAVMTRRLLDTGYIFNRAAVFSTVSLVLVGTFVLVEWLLADWLHDASRTTNVMVSAVLVVALGLSTRFVHARIDSLVDTVFFRRRHETERAIHDLAHEAPYITDRSVLLERAIELLEGRADAVFAKVLLADGAGFYGDTNENDPAVVRLRATHRALDLRTVSTRIGGDFAYPMVARGRLVGILVVGPRRSGENPAPDESAALAQMAHSVGAALDLLDANGTDSIAGLRTSITALESAVVALREAVVGRIQP